MKHYKNTVKAIQNTVIQVYILPKHPHITKQVTTTTVQDTHQIK